MKTCIENVNSNFNEKLLKLTPENADSSILMLGEPSDILLKQGIEDKPLKYYGNKLIKKQKKHGFGLYDLKDLPKAVADPVAIFKGNRDGCFAILTEIEINGNNVLATLEVGKDRDMVFNIITSTYEKTKDGLINWINEGKALYINKEKAPDYLGTLAPIASAANNQGSSTKYNKFFDNVQGKNLLFLLFAVCTAVFAQENGFSYWWRSDGLIDSLQTEELDALSSDLELWCALAELYVGAELAEEAECVFEKEKPAKQKKTKKIWKVSLSSGANLDTNGNFINKFSKASGRVGPFSGDARFRENKGFNGTAALRHGIFSAKGGDLTSKYRGVLSEVNVSDLHLGGEWLFRGEKRDSSWVFGKFSKNFMDRKIYAGGNFRMVAPYYGGNRMWSRTWQGARFWGWNFRATEIAVAKEGENTLDFAYLAERRKKGARLALEHDKNKSRLSAGFKPVLKGTDSLWASSEYPLRLKLGWDKKLPSVRVSNSLLLKETWEQGKPLEFRSESKMKHLTLRWTANFYKNGRIDLRQFYVETMVGF